MIDHIPPLSDPHGPPAPGTCTCPVCLKIRERLFAPLRVVVYLGDEIVETIDPTTPSEGWDEVKIEDPAHLRAAVVNTVDLAVVTALRKHSPGCDVDGPDETQADWNALARAWNENATAAQHLRRSAEELRTTIVQTVTAPQRSPACRVHRPAAGSASDNHAPCSVDCEHE